MTQAALAFRVALIVKGGQTLNERNAGLNHGRKLAGEENEIGLFNRPGFLARATGDGFFLERKDHQAATHQTGDGVILVKSVLDAGDDAAGGVSSLVGVGDHFIISIISRAPTMPRLA